MNSELKIPSHCFWRNGVCSYKPTSLWHKTTVANQLSNLALLLFKATLSNTYHWFCKHRTHSQLSPQPFSPLKSHPSELAYMHFLKRNISETRSTNNKHCVTNCPTLVNRVRAETRWQNNTLLCTQLCAHGSHCLPLYIAPNDRKSNTSPRYWFWDYTLIFTRR